jgi:hypothetical protein
VWNSFFSPAQSIFAAHCAISFARFKTVIASHPQVAMAEHVEGLAD